MYYDHHSSESEGQR